MQKQMRLQVGLEPSEIGNSALDSCPGLAALLHVRTISGGYLTTGHFCLRSAPIIALFRLRWACTSSGGVRAIHWFRETSWNLGLLNISRKRKIGRASCRET